MTGREISAILIILLLSISATTFVMADSNTNDSFDTAEDVSTGSHAGHLDYSTDKVDYYRALVYAGETISVSMTRDTGTKFDIVLYNQLRTSVAQVLGTADVLTSELDWTVNSNQASYYYYIKVQASSSSSPGDYTITILKSQQNDAGTGHDAGDVIADSVAILYDPITGFIKDYDVSDFYSFQVTGGSTIFANVTPSLNLKADATLYDQDKKSVKIVASAGYGAKVMVEWTTNCEQETYTYYIEVKNKDGSGLYTLDINLHGQNDADSGGDAGDSFEVATPLESGTHTGFCKDDDKYDFYQFDVRKGSAVNITCEPDLTADFNIELYDKDEKKVAEDKTSTGIGVTNSFTWTAPSASYVYLKVIRYTGFGSYALTFQIESPPTESILTASNVDKRTVTLSWTICPDSDFLKYALIESDSSTFSSVTTVAEFTVQTTTTFYITDLEPGKTYYYKILVYNTEGHHTESPFVRVTTLKDPPYLLVGGIIGAAVAGVIGFLVWRKMSGN
jgi:hypothetical protein